MTKRELKVVVARQPTATQRYFRERRSDNITPATVPDCGTGYIGSILALIHFRPLSSTCITTQREATKTA